MRKINFPGGGQPVNLTDIKDLQDESVSILSALGSGIGTCVLKGIEVSGTASSANLSEGWVFLDGEFMKFDSVASVNFSTNQTQYIVPSAEIGSRPKNFITGGLKNTRITRNAVIQTSQPVSGDFIVIKFTGHNQYLSDVLGRKVLPVGTILEVDSLSSFDGATGLGLGAWKGWAMCDGRNGTPAIQGRSVVSYNSTDVDYNAIGKVGGAKSVTLISNQMPSHSHKLVGDTSLLQSAELSSSNILAEIGDGPASSEFNYRLQGMTGTATLGNSSSIGANQPHENRPPYIVLLYVKKIA